MNSNTDNDNPTKRSSWIFWYFLILAVISLGVGFLIYKQNYLPEKKFLTINNSIITIEIADTPQKRERGLCCRDSLPENSGMLFIYETAGDYQFWMKDTRIPLDMYWISSDKKIVHIEHNVQPSSYPKTFSSPVPAQYILETNAGYAKKYTIKINDTVQF